MGSLCCCADAESIRVFILDWRCFGISKVQHQLNEEINDKEIRLIGEGGEQNAPLGRAVIGGLLFATVATLFFVPTLFSIVHGRRPASDASAPREPAHV